jgi:hypothetical protein
LDAQQLAAFALSVPILRDEFSSEIANDGEFDIWMGKSQINHTVKVIGSKPTLSVDRWDCCHVYDR